MASKIRTFQDRIAALLLADTAHFVAAPAPSGDTRVPVIVDLPGDIDSIVNEALAATGIACIVWMPSRAPKREQRAKNRRYVCSVWVKENVLLNRGAVGAQTAEEIAELVDELCDGKANGLTPHPIGGLGTIQLGDAGVVPIGGAEAAENDWEITLETEALLR